LIVIMAARRGGAAEGTGSAVGLVGRDLKLGHWRHETFMPMCGDLPDHSVTIACAEARRNCKRRPWPGRRRGKTHVKPGYQACTFSVIQAGRYRPGLVWHASRGWSRVGTWLPCPDTVASVPPFYDEIASLKSPTT